MKKSFLLITTFILCLQFSVFSQTDKKIVALSDEPHGFTYDFDKVYNLIYDRLTNPSISNEDAKAIINDESFPKLLKGTKIDIEFKGKITIWIESNQALVISTFKRRKDIVQEF
jgi:uncharacterized protein YjaZ